MGTRFHPAALTALLHRNHAFCISEGYTLHGVVAELCHARPLCRSIQYPCSADLQATSLGVMFGKDFFLLFHPARDKFHPARQKFYPVWDKNLMGWENGLPNGKVFSRHIILQGKAKPGSSLWKTWVRYKRYVISSMTANLSKDDDKKSLTFFKFCAVSLKLSKTFLQQHYALFLVTARNIYIWV